MCNNGSETIRKSVTTSKSHHFILIQNLLSHIHHPLLQNHCSHHPPCSSFPFLICLQQRHSISATFDLTPNHTHLQHLTPPISSLNGSDLVSLILAFPMTSGTSQLVQHLFCIAVCTLPFRNMGWSIFGNFVTFQHRSGWYTSVQTGRQAGG